MTFGGNNVYDFPEISLPNSVQNINAERVPRVLLFKARFLTE